MRRSIPWTATKINDRFWSPRMAANRDATIPHGFAMLHEHGYRSNFERAAARKKGGFRGRVYNDSDAYKLLEAAAASYANHPDSKLRQVLDDWIAILAAAQAEGGYLNTYFQLEEPESRWSNLRDKHELYCAGHLIEAAITHHEATGENTFLDVATRFADHIVARFLGSEGYPGHPELELALLALADTTANDTYRNLSRQFLADRGSHYFAKEHATKDYDGTYWLDRVPISELDAIEGHAVRAAYLFAAATDACDNTTARALQRIWNNLVDRRMYVTGGMGNSAHNEGFTTDYDLPNETAYQETCASIALAMWGRRMANRFDSNAYIDAVERALYNAVLAGVSLDGQAFFYENPLASDGAHRRRDWYECACCPPNVARLLSKIGGYAYSTSPNTLNIDLYISGSVETQAACATIETDYPYAGEVSITPKGGKFTVSARVPAWCSRASCDAGSAVITREEDRFNIESEWRGDNTITLHFEMTPRIIHPHPSVAANRGRLALARGPLIYCFEPATDDLQLKPSDDFTPEDDRRLGTVALVSNGKRAIPYAFWANREPAPMAVWVPAG